MKIHELLQRNISEMARRGIKCGEDILSAPNCIERQNNTFSFSEMSDRKYGLALTLRGKAANIYGSGFGNTRRLLYKIALKFRRSKQKSKSNYFDLARQKVVILIDDAEVFEICTQTGLSISIVNDAQLKSETVIIRSAKVCTGECDKEFQLEMRKDLIYLNAENKNVRIRADNIEMEATKNMRLAAGENMTINGSIVKVNC